MTTDLAITVLRAGADRIGQIAPLFDAYRVFYGKPSDLAGARAFLTDRLLHQQSVVFLAVERDGRDETPLGFAQLFPAFSSTAMARIWILNDLFVAEPHRNRGVAHALLQRAREFAEQTGAVRLTLATETDNAPAKQLYESLGWERNTRFDHYNLAL